MSSYKIPLLVTKPTEMKFLNAYAKNIGAKLLVDEPEFVGLAKEVIENAQLAQYDLQYPMAEDSVPPDGVINIPGLVQVSTEDNLDSKKSGISGLYQWAQKLEQNGYDKADLIKVPENAPPEEQSYEAWLAKINMEP